MVVVVVVVVVVVEEEVTRTLEGLFSFGKKEDVPQVQLNDTFVEPTAKHCRVELQVTCDM